MPAEIRLLCNLSSEHSSGPCVCANGDILVIHPASADRYSPQPNDVHKLRIISKVKFPQDWLTCMWWAPNINVDCLYDMYMITGSCMSRICKITTEGTKRTVVRSTEPLLDMAITASGDIVYTSSGTDNLMVQNKNGVTFTPIVPPRGLRSRKLALLPNGTCAYISQKNELVTTSVHPLLNKKNNAVKTIVKFPWRCGYHVPYSLMSTVDDCVVVASNVIMSPSTPADWWAPRCQMMLHVVNCNTSTIRRLDVPVGSNSPFDLNHGRGNLKAAITNKGDIVVSSVRELYMITNTGLSPGYHVWSRQAWWSITLHRNASKRTADRVWYVLLIAERVCNTPYFMPQEIWLLILGLFPMH